MADLTTDFAPTANGVSNAERGTSSAPPRLARRPQQTPEKVFPGFGEDDAIFGEILIMVLVNEPLLWAREEKLPIPPMLGDHPQDPRGLTAERHARELPPGGFDLLRNRFRKELRRWEQHAEQVIFDNDHEMKEAAISTIISAIGHELSTTPGPSVGTADLVTLISEGISFAMGLVLRRFGVIGDAITSGTAAIAGIITNHVTEAIALKDQAQRQRRLTQLVRSDSRLFGSWIRDVYKVDRIDDYYSLWLERVPNENILDFRIPFAPAHHSRQEWQRALNLGFTHVRRNGVTQPQMTMMFLLQWLDQRGMRVADHQDLKRILFGATVRVQIVASERFPEAALRPQRGVGPLDFAFVSLSPQGTDSTRFQPEGILVIHERSAAAFVFRFDDGLYHNPL